MLRYLRKQWAHASKRLNLVAHLTAENLALRQQLLVLKRHQKRPQLKPRDRLFWVFLRRFWPGWKKEFVIVSPDTVVRWHKKGFKSYGKRKSRGRRPGRPRVAKELRELIARMASENPLWGAPRIHGELLKLGFEISERTVSSLAPKGTDLRTSQTWRTFLSNQAHGIVATDFLVVHTITFRLLYIFILLAHERRKVVHFGITQHPTAAWTAQQTSGAFDWKEAPRYLLRDRDSIYGKTFRERILALGIREVVTAYRSPWQNGYIERLNGSIRRDCLDHVIIWNERHLRKVLKEYLTYYHEDRTHLSLGKDPPNERRVTDRKAASRRIVALPRLGGLHHRYEWAEAA